MNNIGNRDILAIAGSNDRHLHLFQARGDSPPAPPSPTSNAESLHPLPPLVSSNVESLHHLPPPTLVSSNAASLHHLPPPTLVSSNADFLHLHHLHLQATPRLCTIYLHLHLFRAARRFCTCTTYHHHFTCFEQCGAFAPSTSTTPPPISSNEGGPYKECVYENLFSFLLYRTHAFIHQTRGDQPQSSRDFSLAIRLCLFAQYTYEV